MRRAHLQKKAPAEKAEAREEKPINIKRQHEAKERAQQNGRNENESGTNHLDKQTNERKKRQPNEESREEKATQNKRRKNAEPPPAQNATAKGRTPKTSGKKSPLATREPNRQRNAQKIDKRTARKNKARPPKTKTPPKTPPKNFTMQL